MSNNKQSSVEFILNNIHLKDSLKWQEIIEQAKAMHKEEIMQTLNDGKFMVVVPKENKSLEQYYNENFGGNNE